MTVRSIDHALRLLNPEYCSRTPYGVSEGMGGQLFIYTSGAGGDITTTAVFNALKSKGKIQQTTINGDYGDFAAWVLA